MGIVCLRSESLKGVDSMQKFIVAMVAVICLDVGYVTYTANDRLTDAFSMVTLQPAVDTSMMASTTTVPAEVFLDDMAPVDSNSSPILHSSPRSISVEHRRLRPRTEPSLASKTFALQKTTVITIPKTPPVTLT